MHLSTLSFETSLTKTHDIGNSVGKTSDHRTEVRGSNPVLCTWWRVRILPNQQYPKGNVSERQVLDYEDLGTDNQHNFGVFQNSPYSYNWDGSPFQLHHNFWLFPLYDQPVLAVVPCHVSAALIVTVGVCLDQGKDQYWSVTVLVFAPSAPVRSQFTGALVGLAALSDVGKGQYWCCMRRLSPLAYSFHPRLLAPPPLFYTHTHTHTSRLAVPLFYF